MSLTNTYIQPTTIVSGTNNMTGTSTITSSTVNVHRLMNIGIHMVWTGTPTGTFSINGSNDGTNWFPLSTSTISNPAGAAGNTGGELTGYPHPYLQVVYTNASGTGSLTVTWSGFGV